MSSACAGDDPPVPPATACPPPPPSVVPPPLPDGIPWPDDVVVTAATTDASAIDVDGYAVGTLDDVAARYEEAFEGRSLVTLRHTGDEEERATLAIDGPSTRGTLRLTTGCSDVVDVRLELRPLVGG